MDAREYASERLRSNRDDRQDERKLDMDARLRGSIGEREAEKVIRAIDGIKEQR